MNYQSFENTEVRGEGDDVDEDLRLLLIGKTGSGKSATGNIIFNDRVFESEMSSSSVTRFCQTHTDDVNNRRVTVIDTPDFIYSTHTDLDSDSELKKALAKPVHVILLLLSLSTFTEQEMDFTGWFEQKFGVDALRFTLVLFTHAGQRHMRTLAEMIRRNTQLSTFIDRCGQRYHEFNIKAPANRRQVTELMEKIDTLVSETHSCYTLDMMQETERRAEEEKNAEEERRREEKNAEEERKEREHKMTLERVRRETETRARRDIEQEKQKRAEEEKREQTEIERARRETEIRVREECEQDNLDKVGKSGKPRKAKHFCVIILFAVVSGGLSASRKDSSLFIKGFFTGGSAATAGVFTGILWRLMLKSQFVRICPFTLNNQNNYNQLLLKTLGIVCGLLNGLATGHILGENLHVTALAGLAGALTSIK